MKIAISGTHGSGKTTLALDFACHLKKMGKNAYLLQEIARDSPYLLSGKQSPDAQLHIFSSQIESELRYKRHYDILITDRSILDHLMYLELFFPESEDFILAEKEFSKIYIKTYDFIFKTSNVYDPKATKDSLRPKSNELQRKANDKLNKLLEEFYPSYIALPKSKHENIIEFMLKKTGFFV